MRHFDFNIGDWTAAVAHLSEVEEAVYLRLMLAYYRDERPLPADLVDCCRVARARTKEARAAVETVLREFFSLAEGGWHHARCDRELERWAARSGGARSAANLRWTREKQAAVEVRRQSETDANASKAHADSHAIASVPHPVGIESVVPPSTHIPKNLPPSPSDKPPEGEGSGPVKPDPRAAAGSEERRTWLACPYDELVELYHRHLPDNPRVEVISDARKATMRTRWREWQRHPKNVYGNPPTHKGAMAFWTRFFAYCADSAFLTGKVKPQDGRVPFEADIDFLFGAKTHHRVAEGKYHEKVVVDLDERRERRR